MCSNSFTFSYWKIMPSLKEKRLLFFLLFLSVFGSIFAGNDDGDFYSRHLQTQNTGMYILGSWAVANIATGAYGWNCYEGHKKYFHQMNLFWNTVNLGIAGLAIYNNLQIDPFSIGTEEALKEAREIENILLINSGLDVGYIGAGFLLKHLASKSDKHKDMLTGYGNSLILQGSFLLVFDLTLYGILHAQRLKVMENVSLFMDQDYVGLSWYYRF